jgi:hypothetical protein
VAVTNTPALNEIVKLEQAAALTNEIIVEDGRLYEGACPLFYLILEKPDQEYIKNLLRFGMKKLNECGITVCQPDDFKSVPGANWRDIMGAYKALEAEGVNILTCGTCLDFYGIKDKLAVGTVTNMYEIVEKMEQSKTIIRP